VPPGPGRDIADNRRGRGGDITAGLIVARIYEIVDRASKTATHLRQRERIE